MSSKPGQLIDIKLSFQMNPASICRTMMLLNAAFQSALSNDIVAEHRELWSEVQFRIMDDPICYELRVISIATGTSVKCYSSKSFSSLKVSFELSFSRIMHARDFCSAQHMQLLP